jgi:ribosomal peptide maturation radical SAM protein 1
MVDGVNYDICLVVPPFAVVKRPPLGVALLAASCIARGMSVKTVHASVRFAADIGIEDYTALACSSLRSMPGELMFKPDAYPAHIAQTMPDFQGLSDEDSDLISRHQAKTDHFLNQVVDDVIATGARLIGITSSMQQNMAASAIVLRLKEIDPDLCIVAGGANIFESMASGLAEALPWIDYFFTGEADVVFPDFCEAFLKHGVRPAGKIVTCTPINNMAQVAIPEFEDYIGAIDTFKKQGKLPDHLPSGLTVESSRGCWWGQKNHCAFCGLNALAMDFRKKSPESFKAEIHKLASQWGVNDFSTADNIMPLNYLSDFFPDVDNWDISPTFFYEVKANLSLDHLLTMRKGGVSEIQPGIESLSSRLLQLMKKGVSGHQNINLLRNCRALAIDVTWNHLYGFPGEEIDDYEAIIELLPKLEHLQPPQGNGQIIIERFSPYFSRPQDYGIGKLTPFPVYSSLYPADAPISEIAYHFDGDYSTPMLSSHAMLGRFKAAINAWREQWAVGVTLPTLHLIRRDKGAVIIDTRRIAAAPITPVSAERLAVLGQLDQPRKRDGLPEDHVAWLIERNLIIDYEGLLCSIVTSPDIVATT